MDIRVGPHTFSASDVRKTLGHAFDLLDLMPPGVVPYQTARRSRLAAALDGVDPMHDDLDALLPVIEQVWPELMSARDDLVAAGALPATGEGVVAALHRSLGGVPKLPVDRVEVGFRGVVGDRQATRRHHGRPFQALCLWSSEVIAALAADGHPIGPGRAGENITIGGLGWADVRPGVRLQIGSVRCEVSSFAVPCRQNARWFADGDFQRIHYSNGAISRVYATVLEPGSVVVGDPALVEPG